MEVLALGALHAFNIVVGWIHDDVISSYVTKDDVLGPLITSIIVGGIISIPVSAMLYFLMVGLMRWCRQSRKAVPVPIAPGGAGHSQVRASLGMWARWCGPSEIIVKMRVRGTAEWRRLAINRKAVRTMADLTTLILARLRSVTAAGHFPASTKVSRVMLLPDTLIEEDADVRTLTQGDELEVDLKE